MGAWGEQKRNYIAQTTDTLSFLVTIKDRVNASVGDSEHDNLVQVPIKVIVLDENDVVPEFQNVSTIALYQIFTMFFDFSSCIQ